MGRLERRALNLKRPSFSYVKRRNGPLRLPAKAGAQHRLCDIDGYIMRGLHDHDSPALHPDPKSNRPFETIMEGVGGSAENHEPKPRDRHSPPVPVQPRS